MNQNIYNKFKSPDTGIMMYVEWSVRMEGGRRAKNRRREEREILRLRWTNDAEKDLRRNRGVKRQRITFDRQNGHLS
jgi:hypothetical protein